MSPSFPVKILCYAWRPFTITLASSAIICASRCLILKSSENFNEKRRRHYPDKVNFNLFYSKQYLVGDYKIH